MVRDTKSKASPALSYTLDEWDAFVRGVKGGEFDSSTLIGGPSA